MRKANLKDLERRRKLRAARARRQATERDIPVVDESAVEEAADVDEQPPKRSTAAPKRSAATPRLHRGRRPGKGLGMPRGRSGQEPEEDLDFDVLELGPEDVEEIEEDLPLEDDMMPDEFDEPEEIEEKVDEIEERVEAIEEEVGIEPPAEEEDLEELEGEEEEAEEEEGEAEEEEAVEAATAKPTEEKEAFWAPLADKDTLLSLEDPEIKMHIFNAETVDPHYVLFANGHPFGELRLSDINGTPGHEALFVSADYTEGVLGAIAKIGLAEMLDNLNFRWYAHETNLPVAVDKIRREVKADADEAYKTRVAALKGELLGKVGTALNASLKNFILQNPLKDALVENFHKAGFDNESLIIDLIEDAFRRNGATYFTELVEVADKWMGYTEEAYAQVKDEIDSMDYVHPLDRAALIEEPAEVTAGFPKSVPVRSAGLQPMISSHVDPLEDAAQAAKQLMRDSRRRR